MMIGETPTQPLGMQQLQDRLQAHVEKLAGEIGERNVFRPAQLAAAADYIEQHWQALGYAVQRQAYPSRDVEVANLVMVQPGDTLPDEIVIIGAHYDTVINCPGANDNATGVAALLEISRFLRDEKPARTMRFVAFVNEEPPFYRTGEMGSLVYARACKKRGDKIVAMLCLETLGYYSDRPKSQLYPFPLGMLYPDIANFIGLVGNTKGRHLVRRIKSSFQTHSSFPVQSVAAPDLLPGIGWSDHWSFWQQGYQQAVMVTDTALYRYDHYHTRRDTPDRIKYAEFAKVVAGLVHAVIDLGRS
jgi:Zn-dependent M28 family amino/carboxypeptidase